MSNKELVYDMPDLKRTRNVPRESEIITEQHLAFVSMDLQGLRLKRTRFEIAALNRTRRVSVFDRVGKLNLSYIWDLPSWALRSIEFTPVRRNVRTHQFSDKFG
jgi:hypothetical protein